MHIFIKFLDYNKIKYKLMHALIHTCYVKMNNWLLLRQTAGGVNSSLSAIKPEEGSTT